MDSCESAAGITKAVDKVDGCESAEIIIVADEELARSKAGAVITGAD